MARLQELLAKKEVLDREIAETQRKERSAAIAHIQTLMHQYDVSLADLSRGGAASSGVKRRGRPPANAARAAVLGKAGAKATSAGRAKGRSSSMKGKKVPAKFRNKATGDTWSGRGLQPRWLKAALAAGKKLTDFAV